MHVLCRPTQITRQNDLLIRGIRLHLHHQSRYEGVLFLDVDIDCVAAEPHS